MSIDISIPVQRISQQDFHSVDKLVTGMAFDIHNEFGRFCDEKIYQNELLHRCKSRFKCTINDADWKPLDNDSVIFRNVMENLIKEWGAFLDTNLYKEAIIHFFGGEERVVTPIPITRMDRIVGHQKVRLRNPETAFTISATTKNIDYYLNHIKRFLDHTHLKAIQWVNLNHHQIEFRTIT